MGSSHRRLAAALAAAWEAEVTAAERMIALSEQTPLPHVRARLLVHAAFCRAHASRLMTRLSSQGRGPLPVPAPPSESPPTGAEALLLEARLAQDAAIRYRASTALARARGDLSTAWVCEMNAGEEADRGAELELLARELLQADLQGPVAV